ncbi:Recombinase [compost metagenome]
MKGDSKRRQTDLATLYAHRHGLDLDSSSFQDLGVSAFKGDNAATGALRQFRNAVEEGLIPRGSFLLVESLDRLTRDHIVAAQSLFMAIIAAGVSVVTIQPGAERLYSVESLKASPTDLIIAIVEMMRAHGESAAKASRLKEAWKAKRANLGTRALTNIAPAWLTPRPSRDGFDLVEDRAEIVRNIFRDYLAGVGKESIAEALNAAGVKPFGRSPFWRRSYIQKILVNPAVVGTFLPHTEERRDGRTIRTPCEPVPGYFPAVVSEEDFQAADAISAGHYQQRPTARPRSGGVRHLLAGLAVCPLCEAAMTRITKGPTSKAGQPYLVCTRAKSGAGCTYKAVRISNVHNAFTSGALFVVGTAPSGQGNLDDEYREATKERDDLDTAMDRLVDEISRGGEAPAIRRRLSSMQLRRDQLDTAMGSLREQMVTSGSIFVEAALRELESCLTGDPESINIPKANAALRRSFIRVVVEYPTGDLVLHWAQGGETRLTFAMPSA